MRNEPSNKFKLRILEVLVIILAVFDLFLWKDVSAYVTIKPKKIILPIISSVAFLDVKNVGFPVWLKIPSIKVDTVIERVGLTATGSMDVPKDPLNAGWYQLGPRPGEVGSAVMAGHVDWWNGATAVFVNLYKLTPGDKITVKDDNGKDILFVVREMRMYGANESAADVFNTADGKAHLNLVTCSGAWIKKARQYSKRLVVFTDRVQ